MSDKIPQLIELERHDVDASFRWDNGEEYSVSYIDLRFYCPCAKCGPMRNEVETSNELRQILESYVSEKPSVKPVGRYALNFSWSQGCNSGIYRFELLYKLSLKEDPDGGKKYVHGAW